MLFSVLWSRSANASVARFDAVVSWAAVTGAAGYRIHVRQNDGSYGAALDVGLGSRTPYGTVQSRLNALPLAATTYVAVSSYDARGQESALSNELALPAASVLASRPVRALPDSSSAVLQTQTPISRRERDRVCGDGLSPTPCPGGEAENADASPVAGLCDDVDGSRSFLLTAKARVVLGTNKADSTRSEDLTLVEGDFISSTDFSNLDPGREGARIRIDTELGRIPLDVTLATGTYGGSGTRGWTRSARGTRWTFLDTSGVSNNGIFKMQIVDRSATEPRRVHVLVQGKNGSYPIVPGDEPLTTTVVLGGNAAMVAGECGRCEFTRNECAFDTASDRLTCKRARRHTVRPKSSDSRVAG